MRVDVSDQTGGGSSSPSTGQTGQTAPGYATEVGFIDGSGNLQPFSGTNAATGPNVAVTNLNNLVSAGNSTTTPLGSSAVFTGAWEDASQYAEVRVAVTANVISAVNGLQLQYSADGSTVLANDQYTVNLAEQIGAAPGARYFRVVYTNGATAQTTFQLQVIYHRFRTKPSSQRQQDGYTNETDLEQTWAFNSVWNGTTWDRLPGATATGALVNVGTSVLPAGAATQALQSNVQSAPGTSATTAITVQGSASGVAVPVSAASLPLPSGAATDAHLTNVQSAPGTAQTVALTVQGNASGIALPVTGTFSVNDVTASGSITTQNLNPSSGTATTGSTVASAVLNGMATMQVQVSGTYTGALSIQLTTDQANWVTLSGFSNVATGAIVASIPSAAVGLWEAEISGSAMVRVTALAAMTGTAVVTVRVTQATGVVSLDSPLPAGSNLIGNVGVTSLPSVTITGSAGVSNAPVYNAYATTSITTAAYTQLIASTTAATTKLDIFDSSGQAMILATGASGSEVVLYYVPPGGDVIGVNIAAGTRVAYKALTANATSGYLLMNLLK